MTTKPAFAMPSRIRSKRGVTGFWIDTNGRNLFQSRDIHQCKLSEDPASGSGIDGKGDALSRGFQCGRTTVISNPFFGEMYSMEMISPAFQETRDRLERTSDHSKVFFSVLKPISSVRVILSATLRTFLKNRGSITPSITRLSYAWKGLNCLFRGEQYYRSEVFGVGCHQRHGETSCSIPLPKGAISEGSHTLFRNELAKIGEKN